MNSETPIVDHNYQFEFGRGGLILCRKVGQCIVIGDNIVLRLHEIDGKEVRIAIYTTDPSIRVDRAEKNPNLFQRLLSQIKGGSSE